MNRVCHKITSSAASCGVELYLPSAQSKYLYSKSCRKNTPPVNCFSEHHNGLVMNRVCHKITSSAASCGVELYLPSVQSKYLYSKSCRKNTPPVNCFSEHHNGLVMNRVCHKITTIRNSLRINLSPRVNRLAEYICVYTPRRRGISGLYQSVE